MLRVVMVAAFTAGIQQVSAQIESETDSISVSSNRMSYSSYNASQANSQIAFWYYHTFTTHSDGNEQWVGVYGGQMRPYVIDVPESRKYMNRFRNLAIGRQLCLATYLPIFGVFSYNAWTNDDVSSPSQIALIVAGAIPATLYIAMPYFKRSALKKAAINYNRHRLR